MTYEQNLIDRITYHLSSGGLFNPELADHLAVRNLLMECREALAQPEQERCTPNCEALLQKFVAQRKPLTDEEITVIEDGIWNLGFFDDTERQANRDFARAIEAAHGIKGEA